MTTQPAGEQHTGTLNLTGEGQPNQGGKLAARVIREHEPRPMGCVCGAQLGDGIDARWHLVNQTLEAAAPAIRQQAVEDIATKLSLEAIARALHDADRLHKWGGGWAGGNCHSNCQRHFLVQAEPILRLIAREIGGQR